MCGKQLPPRGVRESMCGAAARLGKAGGVRGRSCTRVVVITAETIRNGPGVPKRAIGALRIVEMEFFLETALEYSTLGKFLAFKNIFQSLAHL